MKIAWICPVRAGGAQTFGWKWRSEDGSAESAHAYTYFYDCCENARRKGYEWRFEGAADGAASPAALHGKSDGTKEGSSPARRR
jgi:hypothetical protein